MAKYRFCRNDECPGYAGFDRKNKECPFCESESVTSWSIEKQFLKNKLQPHRGKMKKGLVWLIMGAVLATGGNFGYKHFTSDEYKRGREINRQVRILDEIKRGEQESYTIDNKSIKLLKLKGNSCGCSSNYIRLKIDDKFIFDSERYVHPDDDIRFLENVLVKEDKDYKDITKNVDMKEMQKVYEKLILKVAEARRQKLEQDKREMREYFGE